MIKVNHALLVSLVPILFLTWWFEGMIDEHWDERQRLQEHIWSLEKDCGYTGANRIAFNVTVTTYNPTRQQCDSTPHITADGTHLKLGKHLHIDMLLYQGICCLVGVGLWSTEFTS